MQVTNKAARKRMITNLFHFCLRHILAPLDNAGARGMAMSDGLGVVRRVHPLLAAFVGDYPEQVLVTGVKSGDCPKCTVSYKELGNPQAPSDLRDIHAVHNLANLGRHFVRQVRGLFKFDIPSYNKKQRMKNHRSTFRSAICGCVV